MQSELGKIWVFDESKLDEALERYRQAALVTYPQQSERINITLLAIKDFLESEFAEKLSMNVKVKDQHHENTP